MMADESVELESLIEDLEATLLEGLALLEGLSDELFARPCEAIGASSLGAHYRHHTEHVRLLLDGVEGDGHVDYDRRSRGGATERSLSLAERHTRELIARLHRLEGSAMDLPLTMVHRSRVGRDPRPQVQSTLGRELQFMISHAVHHYAVMGIIAALLGAQVREGFGVMPSTREFEDNQRQR